MFSRNRNIRMIILVLLAVVVTACNQAAPEETGALPAANSDGYTDIDVSRLVDMLETKDFTFVNVHIPFAGDIPETDLAIPFDEIEANLSQLPADKDAPLVIYCRSGNMSTQAAAELADLGYTNVFELDGGMNAWQAAGYDLVTTP